MFPGGAALQAVGWRNCCASFSRCWFMVGYSVRAIFSRDYISGIFYYNAVTWFLGALIILYLLYPWLNRLYLSYPRGFLWMMAGCMLVQCMFFIRTLGIGEGIWWHEGEIPQVYRMWNWLFYFSLGGAINTCLLQMYLVRHYGIRLFEFTYAIPLCALNVVAVFCFCLSLQIGSKWLKNWHLLFFPAFIIGDVLLDYWGIIVIRYPDWRGLVAYAVVTIVTTLVLVWCLTRVPVLKNLLR